MLKILFGVFLSALFLLNPVFATEDRPQDFVEYEALVLLPMFLYDTPHPDYRVIDIARAEHFEEFLRKYPDSALVSNAKLRLAEIYSDIEKPEVNEFRNEMYRCIERATSSQKRDLCEAMFDSQTLGKRRDPFYKTKSVEILKELVDQYGHDKIYFMFEPRAGGFKWVEEEIGGEALFSLVGAASLKDRKKIYEMILKEYKVRPFIRKEAEEFLKTRGGVL